MVATQLRTRAWSKDGAGANESERTRPLPAPNDNFTGHIFTANLFKTHPEVLEKLRTFNSLKYLVRMPEIHFYGVKTEPPTISVAKAFNSDEVPTLLQGGQKTTYLSGDIVLKPSDDVVFSNWIASVFANLLESPGVRYAKPVKSANNDWVHEGYVAWTFLKGKHVRGQYSEKLSASIEFHKLLQGVPKPDFVGTQKSSWSTADLVAWQKLEFDYGQEFISFYNQIEPHLKSIELPSQLIHGDLSGNFLCEPGLPPAIIDFSPAWAPNGFAEGIMLADAIAWENADPRELEVFRTIPNFGQFAWRGVLRRITEQAEHIKWFDKDKSQALKEASVFQKAIDYLKINY